MPPITSVTGDPCGWTVHTYTFACQAPERSTALGVEVDRCPQAGAQAAPDAGMRPLAVSSRPPVDTNWRRPRTLPIGEGAAGRWLAATALRLTRAARSALPRGSSTLNRRRGGASGPALLQQVEQVQLQPVLGAPTVAQPPALKGADADPLAGGRQALRADEEPPAAGPLSRPVQRLATHRSVPDRSRPRGQTRAGAPGSPAPARAGQRHARSP